MKNILKNYDFIVVGGGISGICTAISAARHGVSTALIQNRSVLGGNASSEMRVHVNGAGRGGGFRNAIESGIVLELLLANRKANPQHSFHVFDMVLWEKAHFQDNLDLYLNCHMTDVHHHNGKISSITAVQSTTEITYTFEGKYFSDNTGDGTLGALAGADFVIGHESKDEFGESLAPLERNEEVMGSTVLFGTMDCGKPTPFTRPDWAYEYTKEMLGKRAIKHFTHGYWWIELDGKIEESEEIRGELLKYVYGVFDYIKNSGEYEGTENLALDWITTIAGKRESRRFYGDYMLTENDVVGGVRFPDTIAYGGWTMDDHSAGGIKNINPRDEGTIWHPIDDIYTIPYRCVYSRNVENLFVGGRCFSASHMAMSSARVMATGGILGQAVGVAVSIAKREGISPRKVGEHMEELQQTLIKDDCYLPNIPAKDEKNLAQGENCIFTFSSALPEGKNINGDFSRKIDTTHYGWISDIMTGEGAWITAKFQKPVEISQLLLRFDPDFSQILITTPDLALRKRMPPSLPYELVKDYEVIFYDQGKKVKSLEISDNFQRVNHHYFEKIICDEVKLQIKSNYGAENARVFDMRLY
ncbi:MAG: FAD-dependent oxidoreductase [Eubacteriales bacterium]